mgnify:CR=1 FL=1
MNDRSNMIKVAVVGGEGIGPEVTAQSQRVLNWFAAKRGVPMVLREAQYGIIPYLATGKVMPPDTVEAMEEADAILWGATGGPETKEVPAAARKAGACSACAANTIFTPISGRSSPIRRWRISAPLKASVLRDVDFVIIRELTSGIYFGEPRGIETLADGQRRGFNTEQYTTDQIRRVARSAFELARTRRNKVCSVDKANVLETSVLWREEVIALHAAEFSDVELTHMYVDNAAMQIVREPSAIRCRWSPAISSATSCPIARRWRPARSACCRRPRWVRSTSSAGARRFTSRSMAAPLTSPARALPTRSAPSSASP